MRPDRDWSSNVGTYRMMIKGPREIGVYTSPGKDATIDREKWWKMGKPMPIAACYGIDPLLFLVAAPDVIHVTRTTREETLVLHPADRLAYAVTIHAAILITRRD